jgi:hypothetical protein
MRRDELVIIMNKSHYALQLANCYKTEESFILRRDDLLIRLHNDFVIQNIFNSKPIIDHFPLK